MPALKISPTALSRELDGETVLVNLDTGMYFGLDEVGTVIWNHIQEGVTVEEIPAKLTETFEVEEDVARTDLEALIGELRENGLVESDER